MLTICKFCYEKLIEPRKKKVIDAKDSIHNTLISRIAPGTQSIVSLTMRNCFQRLISAIFITLMV